jgi:lysophospholipase L1-like esterase
MRETETLTADLRRMQYRYLVSGLFVLPFTPFLYLQGQYTRIRIGRLPDAEGDPKGVVGAGDREVRLLAIGESTVAGVGVEEIENALGGRFAYHLSRMTGATVRWKSAGVSGITIRRTLKEVVPHLPEAEYDVILIALGGNDVFGLNSPVGFRQDMEELIGKLREASPSADVFLANVPMIRDAIALPHPLKYVLAKLAKLQHFNVIDLVSELESVYYFDEVKHVDDDFFSDGVHPSAIGYDSWAKEMAECFIRRSGFGR